MPCWSREQSQNANRRAIKSTTSPSSKAMANLQPLSEAQKRSIRRLNGTQMPFASGVGPAEVSRPNNDRDMLAPFTPKLPRRFKRGTSGSRLSPEKRAMVELRKSGRAAFFASL